MAHPPQHHAGKITSRKNGCGSAPGVLHTNFCLESKSGPVLPAGLGQEEGEPHSPSLPEGPGEAQGPSGPEEETATAAVSRPGHRLVRATGDLHAASRRLQEVSTLLEVQMAHEAARAAALLAVERARRVGSGRQVPADAVPALAPDDEQAGSPTAALAVVGQAWHGGVAPTRFANAAAGDAVGAASEVASSIDPSEAAQVVLSHASLASKPQGALPRAAGCSPGSPSGQQESSSAWHGAEQPAGANSPKQGSPAPPGSSGEVVDSHDAEGEGETQGEAAPVRQSMAGRVLGAGAGLVRLLTGSRHQAHS
jgi:hypothetical protein